MPASRPAQIVGPLNELICSGKFSPHQIVFTQDWHPPRHSSFASSHPGKEPLSEITLPYGSQTLWPDHCVQESDGACFHEDLVIPNESWVIRKGCNPNVDSYSGFYENDQITSTGAKQQGSVANLYERFRVTKSTLLAQMITYTGLGDFLKEHGCRRVFVCGLAFDYCVRYTAVDSASRCGFPTTVLKKLTRSIGTEESMGEVMDNFESVGVKVL